MKIWNCCKILFTLGSLERRDAYDILSLYLSFPSPIDEDKDLDVGGREEKFDLRGDDLFWDEMKRGLVMVNSLTPFFFSFPFDLKCILSLNELSLIVSCVCMLFFFLLKRDTESLLRKQSLLILKTTLSLSKERKCNSASVEEVSQVKGFTSGATSKKGRWADKEAQSLGVGRVCNSSELISTGSYRWEAFVFLYEMLEEYGTHLVEAAWNHQVCSPHFIQYLLCKLFFILIKGISSVLSEVNSFINFSC